MFDALRVVHITNTKILGANWGVHAILPIVSQSIGNLPGTNGSASKFGIGDITIDAVPAYNSSEDRLQYHPEGRDNGYVLTIADNGIGIPSDEVAYIFDFATRVSTHSDYSGSGIGLAIVKGIVERHQGTIAVESTLNQGTVFTINFPLQPAT